MLVPEMVRVEPPGQSDWMQVPGAATVCAWAEAVVAKFEYDAYRSSC
jgi:hypothetical protein